MINYSQFAHYAILIELILDMIAYRKNGKINHTVGIVIRLSAIAVFFIFNDPQAAIIFTLYLVGLYFMFFDHIMGKYIANDWFYLGKTFVDRNLKKVPQPILFFIRLFVFLCTASLMIWGVPEAAL